VAALDDAVSPALEVPMPPRDPDDIPRSAVTRRHLATYLLKQSAFWVALICVAVVVIGLASGIQPQRIAQPGAVPVLIVALYNLRRT
jgi:hypothetical protein